MSHFQAEFMKLNYTITSRIYNVIPILFSMLYSNYVLHNNITFDDKAK